MEEFMSVRLGFATAIQIFLFWCGPLTAHAQPDAFFTRSIAAYADLTFEKNFKEFGLFTRVGNSVFKPEGKGPFPAVVLVHSCGGLQPEITTRAKELIATGFAVLILDSYGSRGHTIFCTAGGVGPPRVYKDAFDALKHLKQMDGIDPGRIYLVGFSLGSFAAATASSPSVAASVGSGVRFRASVGWYGSCVFDVSPNPKWQLVRNDLDMPLLLLLAEGDDETPIKECFPLLENLKTQGAPVSWHIYTNATHGWDKSMPSRGYVRNESVTRDAMKRTVEFLQGN
jgi:dienelactone hydrolase